MSDPVPRPRARRRLRIVLVTLVALPLVLGLTLVAAVMILSGERAGRLATRIAGGLDLQGRIELGALHLRPRLLLDLLSDAPSPLVLERLRITDPDGVVVLDAPRLELSIQLRSAMSARVRLHDVRIGPDTFWRFADLKDGSGVGFLAAVTPRPAPRAEPPASPPPAAVPAGESSFLIEIVNAELDGFSAQFDYPGAWGLLLSDLRGQATLFVDDRFVGFDCTNLDARKGGYLTVLSETLPFDRVHVARVATTRDWPADIYLEVAGARTGRSTLTAKGSFTHIYDGGPAGIAMHAEFADAADALAAMRGPMIELAGPLSITGDDASVVLDLKEPFDRIVIDGRFTGLDVVHAGRPALGLGFDLHFASAPLVVETRALSFRSPAGGGLRLSARLSEAEPDAATGQTGLALRAALGFDRFPTAPYLEALPPAARARARATLDGSLAADLRFDARGAAGTLDIPRLRVVPARAPGLPASATLSGALRLTPDSLEASALRVAVPGAQVRARGAIDLARRTAALTARAAIQDLGRALAPFGVPPLGKSATVGLSIAGPLDNPTVTGTLAATELGLAPGPLLPELSARLSLRDGMAALSALGKGLLGGELEIDGSARLFSGSLANLRSAPVIAARVAGRDLELRALLGEALAHGKLSFDARADGPVDRLTGSLSLPEGTELTVLGQRFVLGTVAIAATPEAVKVEALSLARVGGGRLRLTGGLSLRGERPMAFHLVVEELPLGGLPGVTSAGVDLDGTVALELRGSGTLLRPRLDGTLHLRGVSAAGIALGDARIAFETLADERIAVMGRLFGLAELRAHARPTPAGPEVEAELSWSGLAVEDVLARTGPRPTFRSRLTGAARLSLSPGRAPRAEVRLPELYLALDPGALAAVVARDGPRPPPLAIRNEGEIVLSWSPDAVVLEPARLVTEGGELQLGGTLRGEDLSAEVLGQLELEFLQPFLGRAVDELGGALVLGLTARGQLPYPGLHGTIAITRPIHLVSRALGLPVDVPSGMINVRPGSVHLHNLIVQVDDSSLAVQGSAEHAPDFTLTRFALDTEGELSARLLTVLAPGAVTEASGALSLRGRLAGSPDAPDFDARVTAQDVSLRLRDIGRRLSVETAEVKLNARELLLSNVRLRVDGQGLVTIGAEATPPGRIVFERVVPDVKVRLASIPIRGEHLTFVSRGVYDVDDLSFDLRFEGDLDRNNSLSGEVRVISGRVTWDFDVSNLVVTPRIVEGYGRPRPPNPFLDTLALNLTVRTIGDTFVVQNNLAPELYLLIDLNVGGTANAPRVSGNLRPTDGRFHILGLRGNFDLIPGGNYITFVPTKSIQDLETPELLIDAENLVLDNSGHEHLVRMRIRGPVGQASITFSSDSGLTQNEILLLLLSGDTSTASVRQGASNPTLGRNVGAGVGIAGQATRDVFATMLEPYIADTLALITGERLALRPTVGADGLEVRLFGRFSRQLRLQLNYLQGFQNNRRARGEAALWLADFVTLRSFGEYLQFSQQQGIIETFSSLNLELAVEYPLRLPWP